MKLSEKVFNNIDDCKVIIDSWKSNNKSIVFTNGCFDLIHIGHVLYLEEAKSLGDILIVGINSDLSVGRLKGKNRPIKDQYNRSHILAALASVELVILFEEDDPLNLITEIMPNILVKGGDWSPDQIIGSDVVISNGGSAKSLKFIDGYSTTLIEQKIRNTKES